MKYTIKNKSNGWYIAIRDYGYVWVENISEASIFVSRRYAINYMMDWNIKYASAVKFEI